MTQRLATQVKGSSRHALLVAAQSDDWVLLLHALKSAPFYVGALGSRGNTARRARQDGQCSKDSIPKQTMWL